MKQTIVFLGKLSVCALITMLIVFMFSLGELYEIENYRNYPVLWIVPIALTFICMWIANEDWD